MRLIVAFCMVAMVAAAPAFKTVYSTDDDDDNVKLLRYDNDVFQDDTRHYRFKFEQSDGQIREEEGQFKKGADDRESLSVKGSYHWVGPDGVEYLISYNADENGYQPDIQQGPGGAVPAQVASLLG